nr:ribose-phosphate diphosphokinase [Xylella taiwanensis]
MPTIQDERNLLVFSGNANKPLTQSICKELGVRMGKSLVSRFSDGEEQVEIEESVRRQEVFVVQPTCAPSAENLMELLVIIDALKRASATSVTAVIPYFGYSRQDRRLRSLRVPITAKVAAKMISAIGADRVLTIDLHADQIQGFFDVPVDNVYASPLLLADIWRAYGTDNLIVVSPDVGGVVRARAMAKRLDDADLAIIDKRRPRANVATVMNIIGEVNGKTCVLVDDLVDTAGTLCAAAIALKQSGATKVVAYITHPVLSGPAVDNINNSQLDELVVTDTIPLSDTARGCCKIRQLSVAELLAETIRRIAFGESVSSLYVD